MRALALAALLACAGCAPSLGRLPWGSTHAVGAPPDMWLAGEGDSLWLYWTAPATKARWCGDSAGVQRDAVHASILRLRGQAPAWRPGCEADSACWALVRRQTTPDTVWSAWAAPGARCSVRVGAGEYVADVTRSRCRAWVVVRVQPAASAAKEER